MIKSFYRTKEWAMWAYGGGLALIVSLWFQVQMSVAINTWYGKFYDLLQNAKIIMINHKKVLPHYTNNLFRCNIS